MDVISLELMKDFQLPRIDEEELRGWLQVVLEACAHRRSLLGKACIRPEHSLCLLAPQVGFFLPAKHSTFAICYLLRV